jgi:hypothetical protein
MDCSFLPKAALERVVSAVNFLVHNEGFPIITALIVFLLCVYFDVNQEVGLTHKGLPTVTHCEFSGIQGTDTSN